MQQPEGLVRSIHREKPSASPFNMDSSAKLPEHQESARIVVFVPFWRWTCDDWVRVLLTVVLGTAALAGILYSAWMGVRAGRWDIVILGLGMAPWWWLFGNSWWWLAKSIRRGGRPLVVYVSEHASAMGMDDEGTLVRPFDAPSLLETEHEFIIENGPYYMVARLPKEQVSPEHAALLRRWVRNKTEV